MKHIIEIQKAGTVKDLDDRRDLCFVSDGLEVESIKNYIGKTDEIDEFAAFFVKVVDGGYTEIYGIYSIIPHLENDIYRINFYLK